MFSPTELAGFHVVITRHDGSEILVERSAHGVRLPVIAIPLHTRPAEELTSAIESRWNLKTYCLLTLPAEEPRSVRPTAVLELSSACATIPEGFEWYAAVLRSLQEFDDSESYSIIERALAILNDGRSDKQGPFGRTGWLERVSEWTAAQAAAEGLRLNGKFRQLNASPMFSLIRFETDGPALWFKAVGEPNLREYSITLEVNRRLSGFVPPLIASHSGWNAWLSVEVSGNPLRGASSLRDWQKAAKTLAHLQIASFGSALHLIAAGCKDLRPSSLRPVVGPFFDYVTEVMPQQSKPTPPPLARKEIVALADDVRSALDELESGDFPSVLGHLDLNPGNILVSKDRCVFLDWAEAAVGHPLLTFQYLLEWKQRLEPNLKAERMLRSTYMAPWRSFFRSQDIALDFPVMPLLAAFAYAAGGLPWRDPDRRSRGRTVTFLRSLARRMQHEAKLWNNRRHTCVL